MKRLPEALQMHRTLFGDGANGFAWQQDRNDEFGVQLDAIRESRTARFRFIYTSDHHPGKEFASYKELRDWCNAHEGTPVQVRVLDVQPKHPRSTGTCDLCRGKWTKTVRFQSGWRPTDVGHVSSCDNCLPMVEADPVAAVEARRKWVREHPVILGAKHSRCTEQCAKVAENNPCHLHCALLPLKADKDEDEDIPF